MQFRFLVLGGVIALVSAAATSLVTHALQLRRDNKADQRRLRDLRSDRLRRSFQDLVRVARSIDSQVTVLGSFAALPGIEDNLNERLRALLDELQSTRAAAALDPSADSVTSAFDGVNSALAEYQTALAKVMPTGGTVAPDDRWEKLESALKDLRARVPQVEQKARAILDELEQPI